MPILWIKELGKQFAYEITEGVRSRGSADFSALTTGIPGGLGGSTLVSLGLLFHLLGSWFSQSRSGTQNALGAISSPSQGTAWGWLGELGAIPSWRSDKGYSLRCSWCLPYSMCPISRNTDDCVEVWLLAIKFQSSCLIHLSIVVPCGSISPHLCLQIQALYKKKNKEKKILTL